MVMHAEGEGVGRSGGGSDIFVWGGGIRGQILCLG